MNVTMSQGPEFRVITGKQVSEIIKSNKSAVISVIEDVYRHHHMGMTVNPDSYFLRFPDSPLNRIIALPAHIMPIDNVRAAVTGIKWISSFPENVERGLPRASAVLVLNDPETGFPTACIESSAISASRTAASAASMAKMYFCGRPAGSVRIAVVGAGLISRYVLDFLAEAGITGGGVRIFDLNRQYAEKYASTLSQEGISDVAVSDRIEECIEYGEIILFATTAAAPHVNNKKLFNHNPLVLHLSLRDLSIEVILSAFNVVDDIDHCMKAKTSLHLTEMETGNRSFVHSSIPELLCNTSTLPRDRPVVFSPFGMGILDLALGHYVAETLGSRASIIEEFYV